MARGEQEEAFSPLKSVGEGLGVGFQSGKAPMKRSPLPGGRVIARVD
ncbi:MAG: hypothetical protein AB1861_25400 [Cyanobacteriota bacterium]